jgi:hypothetical protein
MESTSSFSQPYRLGAYRKRKLGFQTLELF